MIAEYNLDKGIKDLKEKFNKINKLGYIKGIKQKSKGTLNLLLKI